MSTFQLSNIISQYMFLISGASTTLISSIIVHSNIGTMLSTLSLLILLILAQCFIDDCNSGTILPNYKIHNISRLFSFTFIVISSFSIIMCYFNTLGLIHYIISTSLAICFVGVRIAFL